MKTHIIIIFIVLTLYFCICGYIKSCDSPSTTCKPGEISAPSPSTPYNYDQNNEEEEEVLATYSSVQEETSTLDYILPNNGGVYQCLSNCLNLFEKTMCFRCALPLTYYNRTISKYDKCYETAKEVSTLPKNDQQLIQSVCTKFGQCTCASFEKFSTYIAGACPIGCSKVGLKGGRTIFVFYGMNGTKPPNCPQRFKKNSQTYNEYHYYCRKQIYTMSWLLRYFKVSRAIIGLAHLKSSAILDSKGFVLTNVLKKLKLQVVGQRLTFHLDDQHKTLRKLGWEIIGDLDKDGTLAFAARRIFSFPGMKAEKYNDKLINEALNKGNELGFNTKIDSEIGSFVPEVIFSNNSTEVRFTFAKSYSKKIKKLELNQYFQNIQQQTSTIYQSVLEYAMKTIPSAVPQNEKEYKTAIENLQIQNVSFVTAYQRLNWKVKGQTLYLNVYKMNENVLELMFKSFTLKQVQKYIHSLNTLLPSEQYA